MHAKLVLMSCRLVRQFLFWRYDHHGVRRTEEQGQPMLLRWKMDSSGQRLRKWKESPFMPFVFWPAVSQKCLLTILSFRKSEQLGLTFYSHGKANGISVPGQIQITALPRHTATRHNSQLLSCSPKGPS